MFNGFISDGEVTIPLQAAHLLLARLAECSRLIPPDASKANRFYNPAGREPGRGWIVVGRADLDTLDENSLLMLTMVENDVTLILNNLVITKEPINLSASNVANDSKSAYLVELADSRWRVCNPYFCMSLDTLYNVPSNATGGSGGPTRYLTTSAVSTGTVSGATNATPIVITDVANGLVTGDSVTIYGVLGNTAANGTWTITVLTADTYSLDTSVGNGAYTSGGVWYVAWTWETMIGDIWATMATQLGTYPGLPFTPDGSPVGWVFQGVSAWDALCDILDRLGCTISVDLTLNADQYGIVQIGTDDTAGDAIIAAAILAERKIHDAEFLPINRKFPEGVRVFFHKQLSVPTDIPPFLMNSVYSIDFAGTVEGAEPGVYHPIWDDLPALVNGIDTVTNTLALNARAQERADDYYRMLLEGGTRFWQRFSGLIALTPGSKIKSVTYNSTGGGIFTDVFGHPFMPRDGESSNRDYAGVGIVQDLVRLGFPSTAAAAATPTIDTDPATGTATGPAFTFEAGLGTTISASGATVVFTAGEGTVTSVALTTPLDDTVIVSGSPVTSSGTLVVTAVDAGAADALVGWDDSAGKKVYFALGTNLSTSGTTLNAAGGTTPTIITDPVTGTATGPVFTLTMGTTGTDINLVAGGSTVTLNAPNASATARGVIDIANQTIKPSGTLLTVGGAVKVSELFTTLQATELAGHADVSIVADTHNYAVSSTITTLKVTTDALRAITGIAGGTTGRLLTIINVGGNVLSLPSQSGSSTAANRFLFSADFDLELGNSVILWYDPTTSRWRMWADSMTVTEVIEYHLGVTTSTIPGLDGDTLGEGTVQFYTAVDVAGDKEFDPTGVFSTVYNTCMEEIIEGTLVDVFREPYSGLLIATERCDDCFESFGITYDENGGDDVFVPDFTGYIRVEGWGTGGIGGTPIGSGGGGGGGAYSRRNSYPVIEGASYDVVFAGGSAIFVDVPVLEAVKGSNGGGGFGGAGGQASACTGDDMFDGGDGCDEDVGNDKGGGGGGSGGSYEVGEAGGPFYGGAGGQFDGGAGGNGGDGDAGDPGVAPGGGGGGACQTSAGGGTGAVGRIRITRVPHCPVPGFNYGFITVSDDGLTWTINSSSITFVNLQPVATDILLGNDSSGTTVEEIPCTPFARSILDDTNAAAVRATIGSPNFLDRPVWAGTALVTGDVTPDIAWGAGATCTAVSGNDSHGTIEITTDASDTPLAIPSLTLTFADGTFGTTPFAVVCMDDQGSGPLAAVACHTTPTTLVISYLGTPTPLLSRVYTFNFITIG